MKAVTASYQILSNSSSFAYHPIIEAVWSSYCESVVKYTTTGDRLMVHFFQINTDFYIIFISIRLLF
jgi:hypothetical protein